MYHLLMLTSQFWICKTIRIPIPPGRVHVGIISASVRPRYRYTLRTLWAPGAFVPTACSAQAWRTQAKFWFWPNSKFFQVYNHNMVNCFNFFLVKCKSFVATFKFTSVQFWIMSCIALCLVGLHEYMNHGVLVPALPKLNNWPLCALQCRGLSSWFDEKKRHPCGVAPFLSDTCSLSLYLLAMSILDNPELQLF